MVHLIVTKRPWLLCPDQRLRNVVGCLTAASLLAPLGCAAGQSYEQRSASGGMTASAMAEMDESYVSKEASDAVPPYEGAPALYPAPSPTAAAPDGGTMGFIQEELAPEPGGEMARSKSNAPAQLAGAANSQPEPGDVASPPASAEVAAKPLLIYEAVLGLAVFRASDTLDKVESIAKAAGGYLVLRRDDQLTVRVPAAVFDATLQQVMKLGDVTSRQVSVKDVTAEFNDVAIRLRNAEAVRERLEKLLERAQNVEEAIEVEQQLARLTEQIETMKGRLKLLRELASYSTITVRFQERIVDITPQVDLPFEWLHDLGLPHLLQL